MHTEVEWGGELPSKNVFSPNFVWQLPRFSADTLGVTPLDKIVVAPPTASPSDRSPLLSCSGMFSVSPPEGVFFTCVPSRSSPNSTRRESNSVELQQKRPSVWRRAEVKYSRNALSHCNGSFYMFDKFSRVPGRKVNSCGISQKKFVPT